MVTQNGAVDLSTTVAGLTLTNPIMTAAGCAVAGRELDSFVDVAALGAVVTRSVTLDPDAGWPTPRMLETASGVLSAVGLQNPGLHGFLATELTWLAQRGVRAVVSIAGGRLAEYAELARRVGNSPGVSAVEVNLSSPEPPSARHTGTDPYQSAKIISVVRRDVPRGVPVLAKVSAAGGNIADLARAVVDAGADGVVVVSGFPAMAIDPRTLRPALGAVTGELSGPAIHPLAVRCVWEVYDAMPQVPIVGVGGVRTGFDALELMAAGAAAVQVGSALFRDPSAPKRVMEELHAELAGRRIARVTDVIGRAHVSEGEADDVRHATA